MRLKICMMCCVGFEFVCGIKSSIARMLKIENAHLLKKKYARMLRILENSGIPRMRRNKAE